MAQKGVSLDPRVRGRQKERGGRDEGGRGRWGEGEIGGGGGDAAGNDRLIDWSKCKATYVRTNKPPGLLLLTYGFTRGAEKNNNDKLTKLIKSPHCTLNSVTTPLSSARSVWRGGASGCELKRIMT